MAEINFDFKNLGNDSGTVEWPALDGDDTGRWFPVGSFNDNLVQITGTFDSNTLTMQGSNDDADTKTAFTLTDYLGLDVTFTAAGAVSIKDAPKYIRPSLGSGASSAVNVKMTLRKS